MEYLVASKILPGNFLQISSLWYENTSIGGLTTTGGGGGGFMLIFYVKSE